MAVLQRKELESSPLADLHAIASELGLEGFRTKRKDDLIGAILAAQGGEEDEPAPADPLLAEDPLVAEAPAAAPADEWERDEVPSDEVLEGPSGETAAPPAEEEPPAVEEEPPAAEEEPPAVPDDEPAPDAGPAGEEEPEVVQDEVSDEEIASGVLDILSNGSGFVRLEADGQSSQDVYVSPAQIRRCELRAGDEVSGPMRPPRRNERHPSLIRVETVNGAEAEPPEERPWFDDLTPVFPRERLAAPSSLDAVPYGKGSRIAVAGPPGAGATSLLREVAKVLADRHPEVSIQVVLAGVRPEELADWRSLGLPVVGESFDRSSEAQAQAAERAVERAKRVVERGGHAAVLVDALDVLPPATRRRVFGAARATAEGGSLTVVAATGEDREVMRWATTRLALLGGGRVDAAESSTLRADELS